MAIFPYIESESIVQVEDKIRISGIKSYVSKGEASITLVEIEPEAGSGFIDVTGNSYKDWYLDWQYSTDGTKTISIRITTDSAPIVYTQDISLLTELDDNLFSTDQDLASLESDMLKYVEDGRNSFKKMHRQAQTQILDFLYRKGITNTSGDKLTKAAMIDVEEVRDWSKFLTIRLIWEDLSSSSIDFFADKAKDNLQEEQDARYKAILKLDFNGDDSTDGTESLDLTHVRLVKV